MLLSDIIPITQNSTNKHSTATSSVRIDGLRFISRKTRPTYIADAAQQLLLVITARAPASSTEGQTSAYKFPLRLRQCPSAYIPRELIFNNKVPFIFFDKNKPLYALA